MANESNKDREEISISKISNEELQEHLIANYNIDIGTVTFTEESLQYVMSNDTYDVIIPNSSSSESDNDSANSGGVEESKTEFVADGKANFVTMIDPKLIFYLPVINLNKESKRKSSDSGKDNSESLDDITK